MLKYTNSQVTFREIPDEITLCINISNCPFRCRECHSKELWKDIGEELTPDVINRLLQKGVTCICFMGGDSDLNELTRLLIYVKRCYQNVKTAWYTGRKDIPLFNPPMVFLDYIKLGPYIKEKGPLDDPNTNQKLYELTTSKNYFTYFKDITSKLWKK